MHDTTGYKKLKHNAIAEIGVTKSLSSGEYQQDPCNLGNGTESCRRLEVLHGNMDVVLFHQLWIRVTHA